MDGQPANTNAMSDKADIKDDSKVQQKHAKRKSPKPSSKKRLEDFRLQKSRDSMADFRKAALERTSVPVDTLISCLADMQIISQKQEVVVSITTRGVGFLVNESYQEAVSAVPKAKTMCDDVTAYRVCLAQQQVQLVKSDREAALADPLVEHMPYANNVISATMLEQAASTSQSFRLTADLINSIGKFEHQGTSFRPIVLSTYVGAVTDRRSQDDIVPDPYSVTFSNLRATVVALASNETPVVARERFIARNPLPGAVWNGSLLLNPDHIMPDNHIIILSLSCR